MRSAGHTHTHARDDKIAGEAIITAFPAEIKSLNAMVWIIGIVYGVIDRCLYKK